jgi:hypothetical protein
MGMPAGRQTVRAWALTCESWRTGEKARTQAVPLEVLRDGGTLIVRLPEVLFWKLVVFEFE